MKIFTFLLAALSCAAPLAAQNDFVVAQKTWAEVRTQTRELDALIAARKFSSVHDAALNLRDTIRELRFGSDGLSPAQMADLDAQIRRVDGLLDDLHEVADHNNVRGVVQNQRILRVLLGQIASVFPTGVLESPGPLTARGPVIDPVCRMTVDPPTAAATAVFGGQTYYFCAKNEAQTFARNPAPFVKLWDEISFGKPPIFEVSVASQAPIVAGKPAVLAFAVRQKGQTALTKEFQLVHEKKVHLIAVSNDLSWFAHEHPQLARDGRFYLRQTFPRAGNFALFSDFTPQNGVNTIARSPIRVGGTAQRAVKLAPDQTLSKRVDGVDVKLQLSAPLQAGKTALLTYSLSQNGRPLTQMKPYLGAMGHLMAISQDTQTAIHTHAVHAGDDPQTGLRVSPAMATQSGPNQTFKLQLPKAGLFRVWAQFGVPGRILTVPFTFEIKEKTPMKKPILTALAVATATTGATAAPKKAPAAVQKITIELPAGYKTGAAKVKAGKPVALTFFLKENAGCGNTISLPAAKWTQTLKVGQKATVLYTPKKSGTLGFQCGMAHMKGTVVVN